MDKIIENLKKQLNKPQTTTATTQEDGTLFILIFQQ